MVVAKGAPPRMGRGQVLYSGLVLDFHRAVVLVRRWDSVTVGLHRLRQWKFEH